VLGLDLAQLFLGAQVDRAEPLAVAPQRSSSASTLGDVGKRRSGSMPASAATPSGSHSSISWISWAMSVSRRLAPSKRSSARAASSRAAPSASSAAGRPGRRRPSAILGLGQAVGGGARVASAAWTLDQRRRFSEDRRRIGERARSAWPRRCGCPSVAILAMARRGGRSRPAVVTDGVERRSASSACAPAPAFGAHSASRALAFDLGADVGELSFQSADGGSSASRSGYRGGLASSRPATSRVLASVRAEMRAVLRAISRSAMACKLARVVGLALSCAPMLAGGGLGRAARSVALARLGRLALVLDRVRGATSSPSMSERRLRCGEAARGAGRGVGVGGKAVPAPQVAVARTRRWPGLSSRRRAVARSTRRSGQADSRRA
jgi:hypothetical protein